MPANGVSLLPGGLEGGAKRRHHHHRRRYVARRATRCNSDSGQLVNNSCWRRWREIQIVYLAGPRSENDVRVPPFRRRSPPPRGFVNEAADFVAGEGGDCEVRRSGGLYLENPTKETHLGRDSMARKFCDTCLTFANRGLLS